MENKLTAETPPLRLDVRPFQTMSEDELYAFCQANRELRIERSAFAN